MFLILLFTCISLVAWGMEPKSFMADWVSGMSAFAGIVLLTVWHAQRFGFSKRGLR
jgi:hypothetical protein